MKKRLFIAVFSFFAFAVQAQDKEVKVGDVLKINSISEQTYNHIDFPRKNIIIKRGGVPNFKSVYNNEVVVTDVATNNDGEQVATLKRTDGRKFFTSFPSVKANVTKAIAAEELTF
ncbi:hypothetical protein HX109_05480 [Galbibacter sp. BG1]|uniref:hypothetical protein n=1 Tax=Galbibacter sp. BG1 TaxID=1170699 RepID=UPI0015BADD02|nr:hypothetical protein [Galbibacter sp. BG1]QLE01041.1 hypothetical protein HX109_05480 [Galbibacter sp. BG1]